MHERSFKRKNLQLQLDNGTQTRLNQLKSAERPQNSKYSPQPKFLKDQNFLINIPQPKRSQKNKVKEEKYLQSKPEQSNKQKVSKLVKGLQIEDEKLNNLKHKVKKDQDKKTKNVSINLIEQKNKNKQIKHNESKKHHKLVKKDTIGQILSFYLGQNGIDKGDKLQQPMKTVYEWQNEQIKRYVDDPNLGDYIIKLPNPDNLSEEYLKLFPSANNQEEKCEISYESAVQYYTDMFGVQNGSKRRLDRQMSSFTIAFYLLSLEQNIAKTRSYINDNSKSSYHQAILSDQNEEEYFDFVQKQVEVFKIVLNYYIQIQSLELDEFKLIRKPLLEYLFKAFQIYQTMVKKKESNLTSVRQLSSKSIKSISALQMQLLAKQYKSRVILNEQDLLSHKKSIYQQFLIPYVQKLSKYLNQDTMYRQFNNESLGYDRQFVDDSLVQRAKHKYQFLILLKNLQKASTLFTYFMSSIGVELFKFIRIQFFKHGSQRKIFKGRNLQKVAMGQNMMWMNNKSRPKDVYTLLRNCLIYQLTQNCLLRTRAFMAKNQNYIMLVTKASEQVLEYYAQKNEIFMEVQIGATDIFSFQPVDKYQRPLRLNSYIREEQFINKYSLKSNKMDKDDQTDVKSTQSEALNLYKKAQKMNPDELRAKIILDQEDADDCYRWIRDKLNVKYINDDNILTNEKNKQQIDRQTWECYYVYNKLIISFINRLRKIVDAQSQSTENDQYLTEINKNLGFMLRIMFVKAISMVNDFFYQNRQNRSVIPNGLRNLFISKRKLNNLWDMMDIRQPTGYTQYIKNNSLQRIWRKYQINERKDRSKFFPAERLNICNKIINKYINIGRSIQKMHITSFFPLHDPFILKGIKIQPYLINLKQKIQELTQQKQGAQTSQKQIYNMYVLYESKYSASDFTKLSVEQKLGMNHSLFKYFSVETVRFYCGQKIAFYFEFIRYLIKQTFPYLIFCFLIQIFLWVEQTQILSTGDTTIGYLNDALIFILTLFNMFWTTNTVEHWKWEEKNLAQKFGVSRMQEKDQKIVTFVGEYRRNFETDDLNYQYVPEWITVLKSIFTFVVNLLYLTFVCLVIIQIFVLKSVLFQYGFAQSTVNTIPAILIAIAVQIFNYLYIFLIKLITQFQNHKTISSFQKSLISKSYIITFVITFISIFIYAFFSAYLDSDYLCIIKTTQTKEIIYNCSYFVSSQLLSLVIVDLIFTLIAAIWPYANFKIKQYREAQRQLPKTKFYFNKFEAIDEFYEEEDKMHSNMFNQVIDNSWIGYMNVINVFTALALFGPALPFVYVMMFVSCLVRLHSSKYEIIFLAKRSIPVKTNSINWWLNIIEIVSVISIITNIAYMIYTRQVFNSNQTQIFFFFILSFILLKFYLLMQYDDKLDTMGERNKRKVTDLLLKKFSQRTESIGQSLNTDILNVYYDESSLKRIVPKIKKANIRFKDYKKKSTSPSKL